MPLGIRSFRGRATEDINYGRRTKSALRLLPKELWEKAQIKLARLNAATTLVDLRTLPGNRLESLKGARSGQFSMRINDQYRICFEWRNQNAYRVEIVDYH